MKKLAAFLLGALLASPLFGAGEDALFQPIGPFGGLNNTDNSLIIPSNKSPDLLNVDISADGKSVKKRRGFGLNTTLAITTSPVHGVYNFYDSNGSSVDLYFNDTRMTASVGGAVATVIFSNGSSGATYQCVDSAGFAYCANSNRTNIVKTNGVTSSALTVVTTGYLIAVTPQRLVQAGFSSDPNRIDFSKSNDFTTWATGSNATDPYQFTVTAPGAKLTHLTYAFNRLIWFKDSSFGYILIGNQPAAADWELKTISPNLGTNDNTSVYWDGILYFRGQDSHIYAYDGANLKKITRDIQTTIGASQSRVANSWTQTTQSDFGAGYFRASGFLSTTATSGSIVLDLTSGTTILSDSSLSNFSGGTFTNLSTGTYLSGSDGDLYLSYSEAEQTKEDFLDSDTGSSSSCDASAYLAQSFTASSSYVVTAVTMRLEKSGSPGLYRVSIVTNDSGDVPSTTVIVSSDVPASGISSGSSNYKISFSTTQFPPLADDTRYWIKFQYISGACTPSVDTLAWARDTAGSPYSEYSYSSNTGSKVTTQRRNAEVQGRALNTSGNIVSRSFDTSLTPSVTVYYMWGLLTSSVTLNSQTISYETQTSSDNVTFNTLVSATNGDVIRSAVQRYVRYKASFSGLPSKTPVIHSVFGTYGNRSYFSQVKNAPGLTSWDSFGATYQDNSGSNTFYIRSSTNSIVIDSSTPSWTSITSGSLPTISTGSYFQIRDDFSITSSTHNPTLNDFTQNWFEGSSSDKSYATYFDDRIWWSVTSGAGATANNKIILYSLLTEDLTLYDIATNGFLTRNLSLYFGSSSGGYIYKYGGVDNDNGTAITSYWKSKDFVGDGPFTVKELSSISSIAKSVSNSSMTVTYTLDGNTSTAYTVNLSNSNSSFLRNNKNLPLGKIGNTFNVKFGNTSADQYFEVYGVQVGYRPRPWAVTP